MDEIVGLVVQVGGDDVDEVDAADLSRALREELLSLDVESVRPVAAGDVPPGAKSGGAIEVGAMLLSLAPAIVGRAVDVVLSWLRRQPIDVEVEIGGYKLRGTVTRQQRDAIVAAFLQQAGASETP
jgi:hypothetical protein